MTKIDGIFIQIAIVLLGAAVLILAFKYFTLSKQVEALEELTATHTELHQVQSDINYDLLDWLENQ